MAEDKSSALAGLYKLTVAQRINILQSHVIFTDAEKMYLAHNVSLDVESANNMSENVFGVMSLPLGIATYFKVNEKDYLVPMATEEPSVIAAASLAAKLARPAGGFIATCTESLMIGQVHLKNISDFDRATECILVHKKEIIDTANCCDRVLISLGGGVRDVYCRVVATVRGTWLVVHLVVDTKDAMGANIINTMAEAVAPLLEKLTGGSALLRILSNLAVLRIAKAKAIWKKQEVGAELIERVLDAYAIAHADLFRCATHNKGVMNGVVAVALATGNDTRAIEAGAHAYAAMRGGYGPLTKYTINSNQDLVGEIELPLAVGTVGGITHTHPMAKINLKILGVKTATELSCVMASVGLAQNFAALRALVSEGIQKGHMRLHRKNIAAMAGADEKSGSC
jgi:hydroxymethylglutaryl-CoA reductase